MKRSKRVALLKKLGLDSCYIYGYSLAGKWLSTVISSKVIGFVDTDQKKKNFEFNGHKVLNPNDLSETDSINFLVAAMDIHEILPNIKLKFPNAKIYCLGEYLDNQKVEKVIDGKGKVLKNNKVYIYIYIYIYYIYIDRERDARLSFFLSLSLSLDMYIYIYIHVYVCSLI